MFLSLASAYGVYTTMFPGVQHGMP